MKEYVLLSPHDGELLKKAHLMLMEGGVKDDTIWNKHRNPNIGNDKAKMRERGVYYYALHIDDDCATFFSYNFNHDNDVVCITLTPENISESVETVLKSYNASKQ
jgi:hypothetical protein